jgi:hypothetical protein
LGIPSWSSERLSSSVTGFASHEHVVVRRVKIPKIVLDKNAKDADSAPAMIIWRNRAVLSRLRDDAGG